MSIEDQVPDKRRRSQDKRKIKRRRDKMNIDRKTRRDKEKTKNRRAKKKTRTPRRKIRRKGRRPIHKPRTGGRVARVNPWVRTTSPWASHWGVVQPQAGYPFPRAPPPSVGFPAPTPVRGCPPSWGNLISPPGIGGSPFGPPPPWAWGPTRPPGPHRH